jgi:hypothetical protein
MRRDYSGQFVEVISVLFKPECSPPPSGREEPILSPEQAHFWEQVSSRFGGLSLIPNSRGENGAWFLIDVPPGESSFALVKALRLWDDLKDVQVMPQY